MYFKINGTDILRFIEEDGIKWSRNDIDAPDSGRTLDGAMQRGRVSIKERIDVTLRDLTTPDIQMILNLILPEFVTVEWDFDPLYGHILKTFYSNNVPATCATVYEDGTALWDGVTFPLIER